MVMYIPLVLSVTAVIAGWEKGVVCVCVCVFGVGDRLEGMGVGDVQGGGYGRGLCV